MYMYIYLYINHAFGIDYKLSQIILKWGLYFPSIIGRSLALFAPVTHNSYFGGYPEL